MDYSEPINYYYVNNTDKPQHASFKIKKPDILYNNLSNHKKINCKKFFIENTKIPQFIPDRMVDKSYYNFVPNSTGSSLSLGNTFNAASLKYYICLRDPANIASVVVYLQQPQLYPNITMPNSIITNDAEYYQNEFYHYYDFTHFLTLIVDAFNFAQSNHPAGNGSNLINPIFLMDSNVFKLFFENYSDWLFEFSESLISILPFKNVLMTDGVYRLICAPTPVPINGTQYNEVDAVFYSTIFPYTQLIFFCDDCSLVPINFVNNQTLTSNIQNSITESAILVYDIGTEQFNNVYNFFKYVDLNDINWVNFMVKDDTRDKFTIGLYLRTRNNVIVPYILNKGEIATFTIGVKYIK